MKIPHASSRPTRESVRVHWQSTESGKCEQRDWKTDPDGELKHYMASSIFAIQMRLEAIAKAVNLSTDARLREVVLSEKAKAERELDLCGEILQLAGGGHC